MSEAERLRAEAQRCLRLARDIGVGDVAQNLKSLAADFLERAADLERRASHQQQQQSDQPPPLPSSHHAQAPAQQQQQPQEVPPNKPEEE